MPLSSSTCERSFSAMRRLKTWLRAKAKANHLNDIMFVHIQKTDFDKLDINLVAKEFVQRNDRRAILANAIDFVDLFFCSVEGKLSWIYEMRKLYYSYYYINVSLKFVLCP